jgi:hypothetical protein
LRLCAETDLACSSLVRNSSILSEALWFDKKDVGITAESQSCRIGTPRFQRFHDGEELLEWKALSVLVVDLLQKLAFEEKFGLRGSLLPIFFFRKVRKAPPRVSEELSSWEWSKNDVSR